MGRYLGDGCRCLPIISLLSPYYLPIISLLSPYYLLITSLLPPYYLLITSLLSPYYLLITSLLSPSVPFPLFEERGRGRGCSFRVFRCFRNKSQISNVKGALKQQKNNVFFISITNNHSPLTIIYYLCSEITNMNNRTVLDP